MARQTGLFGGTFDPVHNGHISIVNAFLESGYLDNIWIIPSLDPPHKNNADLTGYEHRRNMLDIAFREAEHVTINDAEANLPKPSYTIQTVLYLKKHHPEHSFFLCLGEDSLLGFEQWHRADELIREVSLLVAERPGHTSLGISEKILKRVKFVEHNPIDISSSELREKLIQNNDTDDLVPDPVLDYIRSEGLYRINKGE